MFVLTRRESEKIIVCGGILTITVIKCQGNKVRIGIEAPQDWAVHREEVHKVILAQENVNHARD